MEGRHDSLLVRSTALNKVFVVTGDLADTLIDHMTTPEHYPFDIRSDKQSDYQTYLLTYVLT